MSFWEKFKSTVSGWMYGRYGVDALGRALMYASLALLVVFFLTGISLIWYLSLAGYVWTMVRMFSRNVEKRAHENAVYLEKTQKVRTELRQARVRFQNRKQYKYFKCPHCRVRLRLTRGCGEKTITCRKCGHTFNMKA